MVPWQKLLCFALTCLASLWTALSPAVAFEKPSLALAAPLPLASLHTYHERPGQTTFRSRLSLRDRSDRAWQTILFKRYQGDALEGIYLRLVGFPGLVELNSKTAITVMTGTEIQWLAPPQLDPQTITLPNNANQYDVYTVVTELSRDIPLEIQVPLKGDRLATIVVPPFVVHEWRELASL